MGSLRDDCGIVKRVSPVEMIPSSACLLARLVQARPCWSYECMQVLLPSIDEQAQRPSQPSPQQQPVSSGGLGSWLWGTMAGTAPPAPTPQPPPTHQPTSQLQPSPAPQPTSPHESHSPHAQPTPTPQPIQTHSPTLLNEIQAPQQPYQPAHLEQQQQQGEEGWRMREQHEAGPGSQVPHQDLPGSHEPSIHDAARSGEGEAAARHTALQQAFVDHQAQVRIEHTVTR